MYYSPLARPPPHPLDGTSPLQTPFKEREMEEASEAMLLCGPIYPRIHSNRNVLCGCSNFYEKCRSICARTTYTICNIEQDDSLPEAKRKFGLTSCEIIIAVVFTWSFQYIIHNPLCSFMFKCGCRLVWDGGWNNCNVWRNIDNGGPRCPWCLARGLRAWTTDGFIFLLMLLSYFLPLLYHKSLQHPIAVRWLLPIVTFFAFGLIVGVAFKISTGYPYFIV